MRPNRLATGWVAAGSKIVLIPPSLGFSLYAILAEQSNGKLFMAGMLPGIMQILFYMATILAICLKTPALGPRGPKSSMMDKIYSLKNSLPACFLFIRVIGGMYAFLLPRSCFYRRIGFDPNPIRYETTRLGWHCF